MTTSENKLAQKTNEIAEAFMKILAGEYANKEVKMMYTVTLSVEPIFQKVEKEVSKP